MPSTPEQIADDKAFIDQAFEKLHLETDAELEALAGLSTNTLSKARTGVQHLSAFARTKIFDILGYVWARDTLLNIFGKRGKDWITKDKARMKTRAEKLVAKRLKRQAKD